MKLQLTNRNTLLGAITDQYADVFIHIEDRTKQPSCIKSNKVILAFHSPYFHRIFQSRENIQAVDFNFAGIHPSIINNAIKLMYGDCVDVLEKHFQRFSAFLKFLEIDFEVNTNSETQTKKVIHAGSRSDKKVSTIEEKMDVVDVDCALSPASPLSVSPSEGEKFPGGEDSRSEKPSSNTPLEGAQVLASASESHHPKDNKSLLPTNVKLINFNSDPLPDNWTETPESVINLKLKDIDFTVTRSMDNRHCTYICIHCGIVEKSLASAENHYIHSHQNSTKEMKIMENAIEYRRGAIESFQRIQIDIKNGCNQTLAICELSTIAENLRKQIETLEEFEKKNLSRNLVRKRNEMMKSISDTASKIEIFVDHFD